LFTCIILFIIITIILLRITVMFGARVTNTAQQNW